MSRTERAELPRERPNAKSQVPLGKALLNAEIGLRLPAMMRNPLFNLDEKRLELLRRFNEIQGINFTEDNVTGQ